MTTINFNGYIINRGWGYMPTISNTRYQPQHEYDCTKSYKFEIKVNLMEDECVDSGAFSIHGIPCKVVLFNKDSTGKLGVIDPQTGCQEIYPHFELIIDAKSVGNSWSYNISPAVKTKGQIFIKWLGSWVDITALPETKEVQKKYDEYKKSYTKKWNELYCELVQLGVGKKKARTLIEKGGIRYAEDFITTYHELKNSCTPKSTAKRAYKNAHARSYLKDVLGRWITCEGSFDAMMAALEYYLK